MRRNTLINKHIPPISGFPNQATLQPAGGYYPALSGTSASDDGEENLNTFFKEIGLYSSLASSVLTVGGELKHSGKLGFGVWKGDNGIYYSKAPAPGKYRPFYGNGTTGGISKAKAIAKPIKIAGNIAGIFNYFSIYASLKTGEYSYPKFFTELGVNSFTTFGGIYGVAFGIGWEGNRLFRESSYYQNNIIINSRGKDGLLSTPD